MKKKIGELTLKEMTNLCNNECGSCQLWDVCEALDFSIVFLTIANQKINLLDREIEVKDETNKS